MSDIFGGDEPLKRGQNVTVGDDLYGVSVAELSQRIQILEAEIIRTQAALTKKQSELSEAETLFAPRKG